MRGLAFPPAPRTPHSPTYLAPLGRASPQAAAAPLAPPLRCPPLRGLPPLRARRCRAATLTLAPLRVARGWPPPLRPQPSRSRGWARPAPGAGHSPPRRHACGVHGWAPGGTRSLALCSPCASGVALGVKIGGVLRGVLPRSSALRASGGGARGDAVRGSPPRAQPRLRSALGLRPRLRASFKSALRRISNAACPSAPFQAIFGLISALWGLKMPPAPSFHPKNGLKRRCRPPATRPECPATRETRGHLLNGGLPARRGLWTAPGTVPTARTRSGLGSRLTALRGMISQSSRNFNSPLSRTSLRTQRPRFA